MVVVVVVVVVTGPLLIISGFPIGFLKVISEKDARLSSQLGADQHVNS